MPRPKIPNQIQISNVPLGGSASGFGGVYATEDANVTVHMEGDTSGAFQVVEVETDDVVSDPDSPPGHPPLLTLQVALNVKGPGPIQVFAGEAILATVQFTCPADPPQAKFSAVAVMDGPGLTKPMRVPVTATANLGTIEGFTLFTQPIVPGGKQTYGFQLRSSMGHDVPVAVQYNASFEKHFSAPTAFATVPAGGSVNSSVTLTCESGTPPGLYNVILQILSQDLTVDFSSIQFVVEVIVAPPPPGPGTDDTIQWSQAGTTALAINKDQNIWHSGHVNAIVPLGGGAILVGSDTGGVWSVTANGDALPLSDDWDKPDISCMAIGPDSPNHFYAGAGANGVGAVYVSEPDSVFLNFIKWHEVPLVDSAGNPLNTGTVQCMVVSRANRKLVLGCDRGVFWADIPALGQQHVFTQTAFLPAMGYSGAALGPNGIVVLATNGDGTSQSGILFGSWSSGDLLFQRATITGAIDASQMHRTSLASCDGQLLVMYVLSAAADSSMLAVLKSTDGGQTWSRLQTTARGSKGKNLPLETVEVTGLQGDYNNCITVSPTDSAKVLVGWRNGPWISQDGGMTWDAPHLNDDDPHLHEDLHSLAFDPSDPSGQTFYAGNDGGVVVTRDLGASYTNEHNQHLHTLQFEGNGREFYGVFTPHTRAPGVIGGGLQDNGNVYAAIDSGSDEFRQIENSDGHVMAFLQTGHVLHYNGNDVNKVTAHRWDGTQLVEGTIVPVNTRGPGSTDVSNGLPDAVVEVVSVPTFRSPDTEQLMYAMATAFGSGDVYGLFANDDGGNMHWDYVGTVPISAQNGDVWALASLRGDNIFVGTQDGRIFSLSPRSKQPFEFGVPLRGTNPGEIWRICILRDGVGYAIYSSQGQGFLLQSNFFSWDQLGSNDNVARGVDFPTDEGQIYGFDIDRAAQPPTLFASTDTRVFVSRDQGDTWKIATKGLPRRAHCTELRAVAHDNGQRFLYLSTFGRSAWRAPLVS